MMASAGRTGKVVQNGPLDRSAGSGRPTGTSGANMDTVYDVCVVGAGMIGSATARHAAQMYPHLKVCLIGPAEPQVRPQVL